MHVLNLLTPEWIQQYTESFIQPDKLQQIVDSFMEDYDKRKEQVRFLQLVLQHHPTHLVCATLTWVVVFFDTGGGATEEGG